jgi:hypothetical protein
MCYLGPVTADTWKDSVTKEILLKFRQDLNTLKNMNKKKLPWLFVVSHKLNMFNWVVISWVVAYTALDFKNYIKDIRDVNIGVFSWLNNIPLEHWFRHMFDHQVKVKM